MFFEEGRDVFDNNLVENAIRPTALAKKNWLFVGADTAGNRSAILWTVIESCRRRGPDPHAYRVTMLVQELESLLNAFPPGRPHTELGRALEAVKQASASKEA